MDDADRAEDRIEDTIAASLEKVRRRMECRELEPIGACHWCNEYVKDNRLFCCRECSDDWERQKGYGK